MSVNARMYYIITRIFNFVHYLCIYNFFDDNINISGKLLFHFERQRFYKLMENIDSAYSR